MTARRHGASPEAIQAAGEVYGAILADPERAAELLAARREREAAQAEAECAGKETGTK